MHHEFPDTGGPREPSAMRIHPRDIHGVGMFALAVILDLVTRALIERIARYRHVGDAAAAEHRGPHLIGIGLSGDLLDHAPDYAIAEVGIGVVLAGRISQ